MIHLGDITKIRGYDVPVVDCVIGGSPCQDLSIAGKREGLAGARSGLFMEQIRLIKEMREADVQRNRNDGRTDFLVRPRYMVWENVPGAFSSDKGKDFGAVLEETIRIAEPEAPDLPVPEGGWSKAGVIMGDGWSVAWRTHDAQHWGVPQRRKRISLIADFGGRTAAEILFEQSCLSGNTQQGGEKRERPSEGTEGGSSCTVRIKGINGEVAGTLDASYYKGCGERQGIEREVVYCLQGNGIDRAETAGCNGKGWRTGQSYTLNTIDRPAVYDARGNGDGKTACTLTGDHQNRVTDYTALVSYWDGTQTAGTLTKNNANGGQRMPDKENFNCVLNRQTVRRLTPLECERLQGFPDGWTDIGEWIDSKGKKHECSDSARYKALGNSIALPFWRFLCKRISAQYARKATMASLFDGIGGFPLVWEEWNGKGSAIWASEIEEFPIAVTKYHFGGD